MMDSIVVKRLVCFIMLFSCSRALPHDSEDTEVERKTSVEEGKRNSSLLQDESTVSQNISNERGNYSRMLLKTTTLGYDEWWFLTTQRNFISYKDFPGRTGVPSWKEINPSESKKSGKIKNSPTSAGVYSRAWISKIPMQHLLLCLVLLPYF